MLVFLSSFPAGLSAALPDCFLERRITYIMYSLSVLCIVCVEYHGRTLGGLVGVVFFWASGTVAEGGGGYEKMLVPTLHPCKKSG